MRNGSYHIAFARTHQQGAAALAKGEVPEGESAALTQADARLQQDLDNGVVALRIARGLRLTQQRIDLGTGKPFAFRACFSTEQFHSRSGVSRERVLLDQPRTSGPQGTHAQVNSADRFLLFVLQLVTVANEDDGSECGKHQGGLLLLLIPGEKEGDGLCLFFDGASRVIVTL